MATLGGAPKRDEAKAQETAGLAAAVEVTGGKKFPQFLTEAADALAALSVPEQTQKFGAFGLNPYHFRNLSLAVTKVADGDNDLSAAQTDALQNSLRLCGAVGKYAGSLGMDVGPIAVATGLCERLCTDLGLAVSRPRIPSAAD